MRKILTLAAAVCMLLALCLSAAANSVPDQLGSIEVTVRYDGKPVAGGEVTCIRVGTVAQSDGDLYFQRVEDDVRLDDIDDPALAKELAKFAQDHNLTGETLTVSAEGTAVFRNLKPGLYLIREDTPAEGFSPLAPFLVSVPYNEDGEYIYDVTANAKSELERTPESTPTEPTTPPTKPTPPPGPNLPQTGQLNWPVPVLVVLGLGLFSVGWMLRTKEKPAAEPTPETETK